MYLELFDMSVSHLLSLSLISKGHFQQQRDTMPFRFGRLCIPPHNTLQTPTSAVGKQCLHWKRKPRCILLLLLEKNAQAVISLSYTLIQRKVKQLFCFFVLPQIIKTMCENNCFCSFSSTVFAVAKCRSG